MISVAKKDVYFCCDVLYFNWFECWPNQLRYGIDERQTSKLRETRARCGRITTRIKRMAWIWHVWRRAPGIAWARTASWPRRCCSTAEAVVWWRRHSDHGWRQRWRHSSAGWRHERPAVGIQAAPGHNARTSQRLSATHRGARRHGLSICCLLSLVQGQIHGL